MNHLMKYVRVSFAIFVFLVFLYFITGELLLPADVPKSDYKCFELENKWNMILEDGTRVPVSVPGQCDIARGEVATLETKLPENIQDNEYLCLRNSKQNMNIYIDGVLRREYLAESTRLFGKTGAVIYLFLKLDAEDSGKMLTITTQTDSNYSGMFYTVYYGDALGIWQHFFKQYGSELLVAFLALVLGIISILGSIALRIHYHREIDLEYLAWGVFIASVWIITNSVFRQLMFPKLSVVNDIAFYMVMLLPFPFMIYMNEVQKKRYETWYQIMGILAIINFVGCGILHIFCIKDFTETFQYSAICCILVMSVMGITIVQDICKKHIKEYTLVAIGILGACVAAGIQIITYFRYSTVFNGSILALGLVFLLLISVVNTVREILGMENAKQQAVSASEAKARFLAHMSHEIRTPINAVLGMDTMILRESKEDTIKEYALDIQNAGRSLLSIVNDILDFSKIESGKMELVCVEYDLSSMIHDIFNMISMRAEAKELKLLLSVEETLPSRLYGDDVRIRQILVNLMNNAVKYTDRGTVKLSVSGKMQDEIVVLQVAVEDTGIGIKQEDISKLFMEFERIEENRNHNIEGTGLGMNITVKLLNMLGSTLKVESEYGKGSCFSFQLEQQVVDPEPVGNLEERIQKQIKEFSYEEAFTAPKARVLVVDDTDINRKILKHLLKETKVQIEEAASGKECLEILEQETYDVIFLDHMMPDMNGIEVLDVILKEKKKYHCETAKLVALTANAIVGAKEMYLEAGFDDFLSKPIIPDKLENMLLQLLSKEKIEKRQQQTEKIQEPKEDKEWPAINGINWEYAMLHLKDKQILRDTISDFYQLADVESDTLMQLYEALPKEAMPADMEVSQSLSQYRVKVHAMKSSAAMIGAVSLSGVATLLEKAAAGEQLEDIHRMMPVFIKEWKELKERLTPLIAKKEEAKEEALNEEIEEAFEILIEAMEEMDIEEADRIMEYLLQFSYKEPLQSYIEKMKVAVMNLEAEQIKQLVKQFEVERKK